MKKLFISFVLVLACTAFVFAQGSSDGSAKHYTVNVASTFAPEGPVHQVMTEFKNNLETASDGRFNVVIHPSGALGSVREVCEGLRAGTIEMGAVGMEDLTYYAPEYSILEASYLFRDKEHYLKVLDELGDEIFQGAQEKSGIITSAWFYRGARMVTANKPIIHPSDLQGLKFRLPSIPDRIATFEAFGASPTIVDFAELYMAMKTGTVDAEENPPETIYSYKYYEAQSHLMLTAHIHTLARYVTSEIWFNSLSEEDQAMVQKAWDDAAASVTAEYPDPDAVYIDLLKEAGMEIVEPANEEFREIAAPVIAEFNEENWQPGLMDKILSL